MPCHVAAGFTGKEDHRRLEVCHFGPAALLESVTTTPPPVAARPWTPVHWHSQQHLLGIHTRPTRQPASQPATFAQNAQCSMLLVEAGRSHSHPDIALAMLQALQPGDTTAECLH